VNQIRKWIHFFSYLFIYDIIMLEKFNMIVSYNSFTTIRKAIENQVVLSYIFVQLFVN